LCRKALKVLRACRPSPKAAPALPQRLALRSVPLWKDFLKIEEGRGGSALGAVAALAKADEVSQ